MSDIVEEMGGYLGDGTELEPSPENVRQKITCPKCEHQFAWGDAHVSEEQQAIYELYQHGHSMRAIGRMFGLHPESVRYRIKELQRDKAVATPRRRNSNES